MALLAAIFFIFFSALFAMDPADWFITVIRGIAVGAITFLVASGLSLIFGLMDVLNLAHGELFMLGAYVGWTVFVRPDTFMDLLVPALLLSSMFALWPLWRYVVTGWTAPSWVRNVVPWIAVLVGLVLIVWVLPKYPLSIWNVDQYDQSPINNAVALDSGIQEVPESAGFEGIPAIAGFLVLLLGGALVTFGVAAARFRKAGTTSAPPKTAIYAVAGGLAVGALLVFAVSDPVTEWLYGLSTSWRFFFAMIVTTLGGFVIAVVLGLFLGLARLSKSTIIKNLAVYYIEFIRGVPVIVTIFMFSLVIWVMPHEMFGISLPGWLFLIRVRMMFVFLGLFLILFAATGIGNGSTFRTIAMVFNKEQAGPALGWTAAVAAYGAFIIPKVFGEQLKAGHPEYALYGFAIFYAVCIAINWWFYLRPGAYVKNP